MERGSRERHARDAKMPSTRAALALAASMFATSIAFAEHKMKSAGPASVNYLRPLIRFYRDLSQ